LIDCWVGDELKSVALIHLHTKQSCRSKWVVCACNKAFAEPPWRALMEEYIHIYIYTHTYMEGMG
jgi:hypothetical protein